MFNENEDKDYYKLKLINHAPDYQQYQTDSDKHLLAPNGYFKKIRRNLIQLINNHNKKIRLTMQVIFNSTKNPNDKRTLHVKTKNIKVTNKIIDELFESLIQGCQSLSKKSVESINYDFYQIS